MTSTNLHLSNFAKFALLLMVFCATNSVAISQTLPAATVGDATGWNSWILPNGSVIQDTFTDQQTGQKTDDFVGNATYAGFQQKAGTVAGKDSILFRARFDSFNAADQWGNGGNFGIGMDLDGNGAIDLIVMYTEGSGNVNNRTRSVTFGTPGAGANTGPSTTTWTFPTQTAVNLTINSTVDYVAATDFAGFNGTQDAWLTFAIDFASLNTAVTTYAKGTFAPIDSTTKISYIGFTSQSPNALNQDLFGANKAAIGNPPSTLTFAALGAATAQVDAFGRVPEPATYAQVGVFMLVGGFMAYRKRKIAQKEHA